MADLSAFAHTRRWWPAAFMDETCPPGRHRPRDWLAPDADGVSRVVNEDDPEGGPLEIRPGETVDFIWHEDRGKVAWGPLAKLPPRLRGRWREVAAIADKVGCRLLCLGSARDGQPLHPLMLPYAAADALREWTRPC